MPGLLTMTSTLTTTVDLGVLGTSAIERPEEKVEQPDRSAVLLWRLNGNFSSCLNRLAVSSTAQRTLPRIAICTESQIEYMCYAP